MKKIMLLVAALSTFSLVAAERSRNSCLENVSNRALLDEVALRMGSGGGDNPGREVRVEQKVSLECLETMKNGYPYSPDKSTLLAWAGDCRNTVNTERCSEITSTADSSCLNKLVEFYPYSPDRSTLEQFTQACRQRSYICSI